LALRRDHRILGSLAGALPRFPAQNLFLGLPLVLMPEEVALCLEKGKFMEQLLYQLKIINNQ
jgi:hypothetical protein